MTHPDMASLLVREPEVAIAAGRASLDLSLGPDSAELRDALSLVDAQLFDLALACLRPRQDERPTAEAMRDGLAAFCNHYARNAERALRGERLLPCTGEASWFDTASPYAVNRLVSAVGNAVSLAILLGCVVATSVLLDGVPVAWRLGSLAWRTEFSAVTVGAVLLLPAAAGFAARGRLRGTTEGFVRGTFALAAATVALLALGSLGSVAGLSGSHAVTAAVLTAASAGWCPLVLDFAMTVAPALIAEARRALPRARSSAPAFSAGPVPAMADPDSGADAMASPDAMTGPGADAMVSTGPDAMAGEDAMAGASPDAMADAGADAVSTASYDVDDATACPTEALGMIDVTPPVTHNVTVDETGMKTGITTKRDADGEVLDAADDHE